MAEICAICSLPKDLCVCGTISMEQQIIKVRCETRKWNKAMTVIEGINSKNVDLGELATKLKGLCACGGSAKDNMILLQGDHRDRVKQFLMDYGFPNSSIEVH